MTQATVNFYTWHTPSLDEYQMQLEKGITFKRKEKKEQLFYGDVEQTRRKKVLLLDAPCDGATIVLVRTRAGVESHDIQPQPHFWESNTWIGADGATLLLQEGRHRDPEKTQLFRLLPGESVLFIDAYKEVTRLTAGQCGEKPGRRRATNDEVAHYVLGEARKRGHSANIRIWCFRALQELGCQEQLATFYELFPGCR